MPDSDIFSEEKLKSICSNIPDTDKIEQMRLKYIRRRKIFYLSAFATVAASLLIMQFFDSQGAALAIALLADATVCFILWIAMVQGAYNRLRGEFREKYIKHFAEALLQNAGYNPSKYHSMQTYYESLLYTLEADRDSGENYIEGLFDKTELSFSYMHTEYKTVTNTKNGSKTVWHTIFDGVFMQADCNKDFSGKTLVLPDTAEKYLGGFGKWLQRNAGNAVGQMVYMENKKFEKKFVVYSTDPVEARYLITPKIQEEILNIHKFLKTDFRLSFVNSHVFVAISNIRPFVLDASMSFVNISTHLYYMKDILMMLKLVHLLDLNIRIWSKK